MELRPLLHQCHLPLTEALVHAPRSAGSVLHDHPAMATFAFADDDAMAQRHPAQCPEHHAIADLEFSLLVLHLSASLPLHTRLLPLVLYAGLLPCRGWI